MSFLNSMADDKQYTEHFIKKEPKFCRCRICHEHFYGDTIEQASQACHEHGITEHPDWGVSACFCPD
jgi:hypothetical protein